MFSEPVISLPSGKTLCKIGLMAGVVALAGWLSRQAGIAPSPLSLVSVCTFVGVIGTALFFWSHRVAVALLGASVLICLRAVTLHGALRASEHGIILFLMGMMIIVGAIKDLGLLTWIIQSVINKKKMSGPIFTLILCGLSALLASLIDEISSIVVVLALVFQVCDTLKIRAAPFVLIAVLCTNIGSAATMLGNPVGIFIGNKAGFTFGQFLTGAAPVSLLALAATAAVVTAWYRKDIQAMSQAMEEHRARREGLGPLIRIPHRRGLMVLAVTMLVLALHRQIEDALGLSGAENRNVFLVVTPLIIAGLLMLYRPHRARHYVERDVEWWTLLFFMLLFAIAGSLVEQGVTRNIADRLLALSKDGPGATVPFVLALSSVGSAFVDNLVFVAAFTPVIQSLTERSADYSVLWWALLFGACFGGNITAVGSTANLIALGMLERRGHAHIRFLEWLKIGLLVGLVTGVLAWALLRVLPMPSPAPNPDAPQVAPPLSPQNEHPRR